MVGENGGDPGRPTPDGGGEEPDDAKTVARIRGLSFIALLTEGFHHQPHHLAIAKGDSEELEGHGH